MRHLRSASTRLPHGRLLTRLAVLFFAAMLGAACGTTLPTQQPARLTLAASSSALPLAETVASAYHTAYAHVTVDVLLRANDAAAAQSVLTGQADLALVAGPAPTVDSLSATHVATDALAVVVHPDRALDNLTGQQMQEILRGLLRTWDELGAGAGDIQVLARERDSGPRQEMTGAFLGARPLTPTALVLPDDLQVLARVAADPQAIAALPAAWLDDRVHAVSIDGRGPDWVRRQWPGYPAELAIYLLAPQTPSPDAAALREYLLSAPGQRLVSRSYAPAQP